MSRGLVSRVGGWSSSGAVAAALVVLLVVPAPAMAATIVVGGGCTLADAITAANTDSAAGGCTAGSGADVIQLTGDVTLTTVDHFDEGDNGLPAVTSEIVVEGNGFTVARMAGAPDFRPFFIDTTGDLTLENVTVSGGFHQSWNGGGIFNDGTLLLHNSTVSGNLGRDGGGVLNRGALTIDSSTLSGNTADTYYGGGGGLSDEGEALVVNSTISNNIVLGGKAGGGGIFGDSDTATTLVNSTVAHNSGEGVFAIQDVILTNSIVAGHGTNCDEFPGGGTIVDNGNNFDDDGTCGAGVGVLTGLDPNLLDNGGPTQTHALLDGSSAIDGAGACGLATDQRGVARDAACDSGAFEFGGAGGPIVTLAISGSCPGPVTLTVTTTDPFEDVVLFAGRSAGSSTVTGGGCAGTELGLDGARIFMTVTTNGAGVRNLGATLADRWCGKFLQGLDRNCVTSNLLQIPQ